MIEDLIPTYKADTHTEAEYSVLRRITVEDHETAWMECVYPNTGFRAVFCECDFTPGVGYEVKEGRHYSLDGEKRCLKRKAAMHLRHLEIREQLREKYPDQWGSCSLPYNIGPVIVDLIELAEDGEMLEDGNGASFWGGYFYLQTVATITDTFVGHLWPAIYKLVQDKKIGLEGAVIQPYREPPPPEWEEWNRITEDDGWIGIAKLPGHRQMAREWTFEVITPEGNPAYGLIPGEPLMHDPVFGPDQEDVARAEERLVELINKARARGLE